MNLLIVDDEIVTTQVLEERDSLSGMGTRTENPDRGYLSDQP